MKKFKKILAAAIAMMTFSTAAAVTGTVAWFAANQTVNVSGMSVSATSDTAYLLIGADETDTYAEIQAAKDTSITLSDATAALLPVAHESFTTSSTISNIETVAESKYSNWYYRYSDDPGLYGGTGHESDKVLVPSANFSNYVKVNQFFVCTADGSNPMYNLKVESLTLTTAGAAAVKVIVASDTAMEEFDQSVTSSRQNPVTLIPQITDGGENKNTTALKLNVYIYWDGNDADLYTNNMSQLKDTSVAITFKAELTNA